MTTTPPRSSAAPVLRLSLVYGASLFAAIAVVGSVVGALVSELPGLLSALIGAGMGFVFLAVTAVSILLADRITKGDLLSPVFFALVLGAWLLKFVVFLVLVFTLREASFIDPVVLFVTLVIAVLGGLVTDLVAVSRGRVPYVSDITLPGSSER
ncbi:hypothetical protein [Microcella indica]|uniref:hypothetical protein n=1 Tax=Microcella indica TaxID=2750620 RepID=UPI0015CF5ED8|nr:hypothetical protein [Microcella indica]